MNNKIDLTEIRNLSEYAQKSRSTGIMVPADELEYLLSEYDRLTSELTSANTRVESLNKALHDGVPAGMKTAEEFLDWLYSVLPFLVEDGDKE